MFIPIIGAGDVKAGAASRLGSGSATLFWSTSKTDFTCGTSSLIKLKNMCFFILCRFMRTKQIKFYKVNNSIYSTYKVRKKIFFSLKKGQNW
jgi:hypothetical protein